MSVAGGDDDVVGAAGDNATWRCDRCGVSTPMSDRVAHLSSISHQLSGSAAAPPASLGIPMTNRGYQMLVQLGWDEASGLGANQDGTLQPVATERRDRSGLGARRFPRRITHVERTPPAGNTPAAVRRARRRQAQKRLDEIGQRLDRAIRESLR